MSYNRRNTVTDSFKVMSSFNPIALRMVKTLWSFGHSECNRNKGKNFLLEGLAALLP